MIAARLPRIPDTFLHLPLLLFICPCFSPPTDVSLSICPIVSVIHPLHICLYDFTFHHILLCLAHLPTSLFCYLSIRYVCACVRQKDKEQCVHICVTILNVHMLRRAGALLSWRCSLNVFSQCFTLTAEKLATTTLNQQINLNTPASLTSLRLWYQIHSWIKGKLCNFPTPLIFKYKYEAILLANISLTTQIISLNKSSNTTV